MRKVLSNRNREVLFHSGLNYGDVLTRRMALREHREEIESKGLSKVKFESGNPLFFENRIASKWLTTKEASFILGVSENALRIMVHREQVPSFKFGRRLRFRLSDCEALFTQKGAI